VFIATTPDGAEEVTVRARSVAEARKKVAAELARQPGQERTEREPIGGNSPHKTRHEIDWVNPVTGETVRIRITHGREYLFASSDHLQIESIGPEKAPLPITETGYLSHFISPSLRQCGRDCFVTAWIERETGGRPTKAAAKKAQAICSNGLTRRARWERRSPGDRDGARSQAENPHATETPNDPDALTAPRSRSGG
jgi:hypothetical protein